MRQLRPILLLLLPTLLLAQIQRSPDITKEEVFDHIKYLASDALEGRKPGTKGAELAATYIADEFKSYGLKPLGDNGTYYQSFEFTAGIELGEKNTFAIESTPQQGNVTKATSASASVLRLNADFRPLGFSSSGSYRGDIVFVGYGIDAKEKDYSDYDGIDVKEKAVLMLRYSPEGDAPHGEFSMHASLRYKVAKAKEFGARAVLVVTGPADADKDELMKLSFDQQMGDAGIPVLSIKQSTANLFLAASQADLKTIQLEINSAKKPRSFVIKNATVSLSTDIKPIRQKTENVVGYLEGADPVLKGQVVVIGAHYDHLGYGGEGSGSLAPDTVAIHNGADDNASGTAGVLELAQYFVSKKTRLKRSLLFLAFSGEEMGLLGSGYYVKNPVIPLERTITMINMDEIGRLRNRKLIVYGMGTSPGFEALVSKYNTDSSLDLKLMKDGFGPSDHASFYGKHIPVFHFFTDLHSDYHRPSDDYDKINAAGEVQVLKLVANVATELDTITQRPSYAQVETPKPQGGDAGRGGVRSYTGTIPDFGEQVEGMKLAGVREGSPAAKAGLQAGDIIVKFGKLDIKNLYDYTYALGEYKPGDEVEVVAKRGNETKTFKVKLERRSQ